MARRSAIPGQLGMLGDELELAPAGRSSRPRPGVRYRRRAAADDCAACWAGQHQATVRGLPVSMRQRATWVREEFRDTPPNGPGYQTGAAPAVTALCGTHKAEREHTDQASALPGRGSPRG